MTKTQSVTVVSPPGQTLNGLGMMVSQYLEQVFAECPESVKDALRTRCVISMGMGKDTTGTISFMGDRVLVENGVAKRPDLYISGNYLDLSGVLAGTLNPVVGVLKGAIKIERIPRVTRLFDCLRVLKLLKAAPETASSEEI